MGKPDFSVERDFRFSEHSEAGSMAEWTCPNCGDTVTWAESAWWKFNCSCSRWTAGFTANGYLKEKESADG
jgi:endogenous inhibitor of DNA gyrase (YacG/DUF329 family)